MAEEEAMFYMEKMPTK